MNRHSGRRIRILIPGLFALLVASSAAFAQTEERGPAFEVFGGYFGGYSTATGLTFHSDTIGVRGSFRLTSVWAVEAALSRSSDSRVTWNGDLSAKAYLLQRDHFGLFALAGPGIHREDVGGQSSDTATVHAGIGAEIALSARTYLRPEVLARWPTAHLNDRYRSTDYTLGFGWRF